ncbi:low-density lipoprotein receptor class A domain-containing protein 2-like isoform X3 [Biomphalaria glabrata]|uniref:Low-density lipoprotein receptor class A domain-containing protein 2-like isoform X3 n=1 Tax=Biomphalaria glabrata TaxID=6526 RepID=A0A9W3AVJ3_BIOGL|nr:low-density lipoprotein receptor class A domain-containing protein 2-like isoform X3 [Biomphalaria glabrata]
MAYGHDWLVQSASFFWIFTLMLSESQSKRTQLYFMDESDCGNTKTVGGALVYSHSPSRGDYYPHDIDCQITFEAESGDFKLMMRVIEMDLPDRTATGKCNDALYVYDANTFLARAMEHAGGAGGLCGSLLPSTLKSTGPHLTVVFKTDSDGPVGRGFKFIITAYSEGSAVSGNSSSDQWYHSISPETPSLGNDIITSRDDKKSNNCGSSFECDNKMCIPMSLTCDGTDNCGDYSDEAGSGRAKCKEGAYYFHKPDLIVTNFQIERDLLQLLMNFEILQLIEEQILSAST